MFDLNRILKNAQIYSIEYCGFYILKFSIPSNLEFSKSFSDVNLEFNSGIYFLNSTESISNKTNLIYDLYGSIVSDAKLSINNDIELELSNGFKIISLKEENVLIDQDWLLYANNREENYILNDGEDFFISDSFKNLIS